METASCMVCGRIQQVVLLSSSELTTQPGRAIKDLIILGYLHVLPPVLPATAHAPPPLLPSLHVPQLVLPALVPSAPARRSRQLPELELLRHWSPGWLLHPLHHGRFRPPSRNRKTENNDPVRKQGPLWERGRLPTNESPFGSKRPAQLEKRPFGEWSHRPRERSRERPRERPRPIIDRHHPTQQPTWPSKRKRQRRPPIHRTPDVRKEPCAREERRSVRRTRLGARILHHLVLLRTRECRLLPSPASTNHSPNEPLAGRAGGGGDFSTFMFPSQPFLGT